MENCPRRSTLQKVICPTINVLLLVMLSFAGLVPARSQSVPQSPSPPAQPSAQTQAQAAPKEDTLAEAARKARAKKNKSAPPKVYTDDDVSGSRGGGVSVVGQASSTGVSTDAKNGNTGSPAGAKSGKSDEEFWRSKAGKLHDQMAAVDHQIDALKEDIRKNGSSGFDASTGLKQNVIYVNDKNARVQQLEKKKEELQKQLDQLQEEGRKAGAPAGWFR